MKKGLIIALAAVLVLALSGAAMAWEIESKTYVDNAAFNFGPAIGAGTNYSLTGWAGVGGQFDFEVGPPITVGATDAFVWLYSGGDDEDGWMSIDVKRTDDTAMCPPGTLEPVIEALYAGQELNYASAGYYNATSGVAIAGSGIIYLDQGVLSKSSDDRGWDDKNWQLVEAWGAGAFSAYITGDLTGDAWGPDSFSFSAAGTGLDSFNLHSSYEDRWYAAYDPFTGDLDGEFLVYAYK